MQFKSFFIPARYDNGECEECNRFLRSKKILSVDRQFTTEGNISGWALLVNYLDVDGEREQRKKPRVDYKQLLSEKDFKLFTVLRQKRKELAEREGVPVYQIFSNEQLAEIAKSKITVTSELAKIAGVGEAKIGKYSTILDVVNNYLGKQGSGDER